jgi:hypothetical protein
MSTWPARADAEASQLLRRSLVVVNEIVELKNVDLAAPAS